MAAFRDQNGKEWVVKLDGPTIKTVRSELNIDLVDLQSQPYERLAEDPVALVDVLWILCRNQAGPVTPEQFGQALVGDAIDSATAALLQALTDFFPQKRRSLLQALAAKNQQVRDKAMAMAMEKIEDPDIEQQLTEAMAVRIQAELEAALTRLKSATSSPVS